MNNIGAKGASNIANASLSLLNTLSLSKYNIVKIITILEMKEQNIYLDLTSRV